MTKQKAYIEKSTTIIEKKIKVSDPQKIILKSTKQGKVVLKVKQSTAGKKVLRPCPLVIMKEELINSERFIENIEDTFNRTTDLKCYVEFGCKDAIKQIIKDQEQKFTVFPVKKENEIEKQTSLKYSGFNSNSTCFNQISYDSQASDRQKKENENVFCSKHNNPQLKQIGQLFKLTNFKENLARQRYEKWIQEMAQKCYIDPHELNILQTLPRRQKINIFDPKNILLDELYQYELKPNSANQNNNALVKENKKGLNTVAPVAPKFISKRAEKMFKRKLKKYFEANSNSKYL